VDSGGEALDDLGMADEIRLRARDLRQPQEADRPARLRNRSVTDRLTWTGKARQTNFTSNGNYEQFSNRAVPFAGDYLRVTSMGSFAFGVWTDWRGTVAGTDPREPSATDGADVLQCRTFDTSAQAWSGDLCPRNGGLD
jgi:hypothetical protein